MAAICSARSDEELCVAIVEMSRADDYRRTECSGLEQGMQSGTPKSTTDVSKITKFIEISQNSVTVDNHNIGA